MSKENLHKLLQQADSFSFENEGFDIQWLSHITLACIDQRVSLSIADRK